MSVYKIVIGKDMAPQNKNTSQIYKIVRIYHMYAIQKVLRTKTFGRNTFCIALHELKMDNFNFVNYKITYKNNSLSLMNKYYCQ